MPLAAESGILQRAVDKIGIFIVSRKFFRRPHFSNAA
jgi:hypothetical protein